VQFNGGDLLIKGVAGSGKTLVLLKRAVRLLEDAKKSGEDVSIGFFTYANTLSKYAEEVMEGHNEKGVFEIRTFHSWASSVLKSMKIRHNVMSDRKDKTPNLHDVIEEAVKTVMLQTSKSSRLFSLESDFWKEEICWIKGKRISSLEEYQQAERKGRGSAIRLSKEEKSISWNVFGTYNKLLKNENKCDWDDLSNMIIENFGQFPAERKFDYVFVDEGQDLSLSQLMLLRMVCRKCMAIAADKAQKIYKNSFSWNEIGIDVKGHSSKSLSKNFRSTRQITSLAQSLMSKDGIVKSGDPEYTTPEISDIEGNKPTLMECRDYISEDNAIIHLIKGFLKNGQGTIGVIYRTKKQRYLFETQLKKLLIGYQLIDKQHDGSVLTPGVKLVILHSAKGLEFDTVIIPRLKQGTIPIEVKDLEKDNMESHLETERRLLYVGMTRAKKELYMLYYGEKSTFIDDLDTEFYKLEKI
jgi:superfamily I DNA/RNA helicase